MKQVANQYEVTLNLRGRSRQFGVKTINYVKVHGMQNMIIIGATLILFLIFTLINSSFAGSSNLLTMTKSFVPYAILGLGVTFVIATGGIDLSIGTSCIASAVMAGAICETSTTVNDLLWLTIPLMLIFGLVFGLINGFLVAKCKLPPFIATLGTMLFSRGISAIIAESITGRSSAIKYPASSWFQQIFTNLNGFPIGLVWVVVLTIICMVVMYKTKVGRYILAIGSNEEATRLSGINVDKYKVIAYAIGGLFAGMAALFWTASNPSLTLASGNGMELDAIAGVYIGGTSTTGGFASIIGTIFGSIILVVIRQGLNFTLIQFDSTLTATFITYAVTGLIVVGAVLLDVFKKKSMNRVKIERGAKKLRRTTAEEVEALRVERDVQRSRAGDVSIRAGRAKRAAVKAGRAEAAALKKSGEADKEAAREIIERAKKEGSEAAAAILETKESVAKEAQDRIAEINAEILALKKQRKEQLPGLKKEDTRIRREEKAYKAKARRAEHAERRKKNG